MDDQNFESKLAHLNQLITTSEIASTKSNGTPGRPTKGRVVSVPRIDPKKPYSEFLCVEKIRPTAGGIQKFGQYYEIFQEQERLEFIPQELQTLRFYMKLKFPHGFYGLVLSNEKFIVSNPVILSGFELNINVLPIAKATFYTQKKDPLLRFILLPIVATEIREVLNVLDLSNDKS